MLWISLPRRIASLLAATFFASLLSAATPSVDAVRPESIQSASRGLLRGNLMPIDVRELSAFSAGVIEKFEAEEGQQVAAGDLLVQLTADVERAEVARAEAILEGVTAELARASREMTRTGALRKDDIGSAKEFDEAQDAHAIASARQKQAQADVALARARLKERSIFAPMAGLVDRRRRAVGEFVERSEVVVKMVDISKLELLIYGGADLWGKFQPGQTVRLMVESGAANGMPIAGTVSFVDRTMAEAGTFRIKIRVEANEKVGTGIQVRLQLPSEVN